MRVAGVRDLAAAYVLVEEVRRALAAGGALAAALRAEIEEENDGTDATETGSHAGARTSGETSGGDAKASAGAAPQESCVRTERIASILREVIAQYDEQAGQVQGRDLLDLAAAVKRQGQEAWISLIAASTEAKCRSYLLSAAALCIAAIEAHDDRGIAERRR